MSSVTPKKKLVHKLVLFGILALIAIVGFVSFMMQKDRVLTYSVREDLNFDAQYPSDEVNAWQTEQKVVNHVNDTVENMKSIFDKNTVSIEDYGAKSHDVFTIDPITFKKSEKDIASETNIAKENTKAQDIPRTKLFAMGQCNIDVSQRQFGESDSSETSGAEDGFLRPNFVQPYNCQNVLISGLKIINSPMWEINPVLCDSVCVEDCNVDSHLNNNDGCDVECGYRRRDCRL